MHKVHENPGVEIVSIGGENRYCRTISISIRQKFSILCQEQFRRCSKQVIKLDKLCGINHFIINSLESSISFQPYFPFSEWDPGIPPVAQAHLDYLAPEYGLTRICDVSSDMFSLGVLFYACFTNGKTIFNCQNEFHAFKKNIEGV